MYGIADISRLRDFSSGSELITVFLADEFDFEACDWFFRTWVGLHKLTGQHWHMLVPTNVEIGENIELVTQSNFNLDLASQLREEYKILSEALPCIVFDNFNEEEKQRYLPLSHRSHGQTKKLMHRIASRVKKLSEMSRYDLTGAVLDAEILHSTSRALFSYAGRAASIVSRLPSMGN